MAKVSTILLAMESRNVDDFKGKSLDEICLSSSKCRLYPNDYLNIFLIVLMILYCFDVLTTIQS
jgi:hypothetical protein